MSHKCPSCKRTFHSDDSIEKNVGFRIFQGHKYVQSWCKQCRTDERSEKRLKR